MDSRPIKIQVYGKKMDMIYNSENWEMAKDFLHNFVENLVEKSFEDLTIHLMTREKNNAD